MPIAMSDCYLQLEKRFAKLYRLSHLLSLAGWDAQVNMPPKGAESRGEATSELESYMHELMTADVVKQWLDDAEASKSHFNEVQRANLREMRRAWQMEACLPEDFVERKAKLTTMAQVQWQKSRAGNDFSSFLPTLKELVSIAREEAAYRAGDSGKSLYEALVDVFEPGMTLERLDSIFNDVKSWLPGLLKEVVERQKERPALELKTPFHQKDQEALARVCMDLWKFDLEAGRLDASAHPFTGMTKEDCRITTRYCPEDLEMSMYAVIHETGHGKYEQNCGPLDQRGQPVCNARSLGIHESQSLFAEKMMGRSSAFIEFITPKLSEIFGEQQGFTFENMQRVIHRVEPGFIRVSADEVCYPLHVILRYEIERDLIEGRMEAEDVPRVWNEKMMSYLGVDTEGHDDKGCLQDVHWSFGGFGYFPTYSLGSMFAAQLMATIRKELGADVVNTCLRTGELTPILEKQREKIWSKGCLFETEELMKQATGEPLNPKYFREHLECRYLRRED